VYQIADFVNCGTRLGDKKPDRDFLSMELCDYAKAVLKFAKLNTVAQQREAVAQGRSLLPYRLRYRLGIILKLF
jgi:hypothetical protein